MEIVVDLGLVSKLELDLIEVGVCILHFESLEAGGLRAAGDPWGPLPQRNQEPVLDLDVVDGGVELDRLAGFWE